MGFSCMEYPPHPQNFTHSRTPLTSIPPAMHKKGEGFISHWCSDPNDYVDTRMKLILQPLSSLGHMKTPSSHSHSAPAFTSTPFLTHINSPFIPVHLTGSGNDHEPFWLDTKMVNVFSTEEIRSTQLSFNPDEWIGKGKTWSTTLPPHVQLAFADIQSVPAWVLKVDSEDEEVEDNLFWPGYCRFLPYFCFMQTFWPKFHVWSSMQMDLKHIHVQSVLQMEMVQNAKSDLNADRNTRKSCIHKCPNLAVLDRTFDSIYQGPSIIALRGLASHPCRALHLRCWASRVAAMDLVQAVKGPLVWWFLWWSVDVACPMA